MSEFEARGVVKRVRLMVKWPGGGPWEPIATVGAHERRFFWHVPQYRSAGQVLLRACDPDHPQYCTTVGVHLAK